MEIEDAFTQEAIQNAETDVSGDMETEVRSMIDRVCQANEIQLTRDEQNIAVLCFVAGRTYQDSLNMIQVDMTPNMATEFMAFLAQRGAT